MGKRSEMSDIIAWLVIECVLLLVYTWSSKEYLVMPSLVGFSTTYEQLKLMSVFI